MLVPGATFGHYQIEEVIGSGSMGVVYKAKDKRFNRTVALKTIDKSLLKTSTYKEQLAKEAEAVSKIDSPHVIKMWEFSEFENIPFLSLEYASGNDLRDVLDTFDFEQKVNIARQIGEGLKSAHSQNLIHRDLKPENIKITDDGQVKILDLGLAKNVNADSVDQFGDIEGTLYYLSPEQVTGETLTFSSDIFSYGVILYEMFTGKRPFDGDYPAAIIYSILHEEPEVPSNIYNGLPGWCDELIIKLLGKHPENRYENIQIVLDFIERSLSDKTEYKKQKQSKVSQTVTIIDLKNLSGDKSWDYFCTGFTQDLMNEISRRTNLIVSTEPANELTGNIQAVFEKYRSDFVVLGTLMNLQDTIKLTHSVYSSQEHKMISGKSYKCDSKDLFNIMSQAVDDISSALSEVSGTGAVDVEDYFKTDIDAYDYYLKGKNYYQTSKPEDLQIAEQMFEKALQIDPNLAAAHSGLSDIYTFQYMAYYDRSQEKIDKARVKALKALEISPKLPEAHRSLGRYYMFIGAFDSAEEEFKKAIEYNPKYAIGYRTLAWLKTLKGENENALHWAKQALVNAPNDMETLLLLSLVNLHLAKFTVAMATLQRAIELTPDYGRAYYYLGRVYLKLRVLGPALENFNHAITYKGDPNAYIDAGYTHFLRNEIDLAKKRFLESIEADYFPFIAYYFLGFMENKTGDKETAIKHFKDAERVSAQYEQNDQKNPHFKAYRAMALASLGENEKALGILDNLDEWENYDGEALYSFAHGYAILGKHTMVRKLLKMAIKKNPGPTLKEINSDPHFKNIQLKLNDD